MEYFTSLFLHPSIVQTLLILTLTIGLGLIAAEHLKIKSFSLGVTWILFAGILLSGLGIVCDHTVLGFAKDFGLILFVYSIGLQVGPSFFSSLSQGGLKLNLLAAGIVLMGCATAIAIHFITGEDMATMVGVMSGAVTNTPSLGAAQQAFADAFGFQNPKIATGYAVAYPLGVIGIIVSIMLVRLICRAKLDKEEQRLKENETKQKDPLCVDILLQNQQFEGQQLSIAELKQYCPVSFIVSRAIHADGTDEVVDATSRFGIGDTLRFLIQEEDLPIISLLGQVKKRALKGDDNTTGHLVSRKIVVTKEHWNGKRIGSLNLRTQYHVTITRINRAGINLLATDNLVLQLADRIVVVGEEKDVQKVADIFGNELKKLDQPNLLPIFLGIALGIMIGMVAVPIPGMTQRFKLGLAGGALIAAILIGRFGPYYRLVTFATTSANRMLREVGLSLFLAAVGLGAGADFVPTLMAGGYWWVLYGVIITMLPLLVMGIIGYKACGINYFTMAGLMSGAMTDPPALAYSGSLSQQNDQANVAYATVYPLTMFLRVMCAQLIILLMC